MILIAQSRSVLIAAIIAKNYQPAWIQSALKITRMVIVILKIAMMANTRSEKYSMMVHLGMHLNHYDQTPILMY